MNTDHTVRDVMHREFLGVNEADTLGEAAQLLLDEGTDCVIVLRGRQPVGRLTPRMILGQLLEDSEAIGDPVSEYMEPPPPTIDGDERLENAGERIISEGANMLVVTNESEVTGILTERDVLVASTTRERAATEPPDPETSAPETPDEPPTIDPEQSVCESCGSLVSDLRVRNGQLICGNCLDVSAH